MSDDRKKLFLVSLLVRGDPPPEVIQEVRKRETDQDVLEYLKERGYITIGLTQNDTPCSEPEEPEMIDKLLYTYYRVKEARYLKTAY